MARAAAPVAVGFRTINSGAMVSGTGDVVRVRHREYVGDVLGSTAFSTTVFKINPGLAGSFPWLANMAANFEKYRFRSLRFMFESSVATTQAGSVMLGIDLDTLDAVPATKAQMLQMQNVVRSNVWDCSQSSLPEGVPELFTRTGAVPAGADAKTYDAGQLIIGVVGTADTSVIGEAWFEYDVELHTPQFAQAAVFSLAATTATGAWDASTFLGELRAQPAGAGNEDLTIFGFSGTYYQITLVSDLGTSATVTGAPTVFNEFITGTSRQVQVIVVNGTSAFTILRPTGVTNAELFVTPLQAIGASLIRSLERRNPTDGERVHLPQYPDISCDCGCLDEQPVADTAARLARAAL